MRTRFLKLLQLAAGLLLATAAWQTWAATGAEAAKGMSHRNAAGFFDIHVCNWPDRPVFLMALFSTIRFNEIADIEVFDPAKKSIGKLDLASYRLSLEPGKPEKRVFMKQFTLAQQPANGWYSVLVRMRSGEQLPAYDLVTMGKLPRVANMVPADGAENVPLPRELRWDPIPGAGFYQVFIKDLWDGERLIYTSTFLNQPLLALPPGLLQAGGLYAWRVHARDVNDDPIVGDFNLGSLGPEIKFSVAP